MSCLGRFLEARREKVEAYVESTGDKKIMLIIQKVNASEIQCIMKFLWELRAEKTLEIDARIESL